MLLRNRSRAVTKPALMADHSSQPSPNQNYARAIPYLFGSPKFRDFTTKCVSGTEALRSPTSILDTRALSPFGNPFSYDRGEAISPKISSGNKSSLEAIDSKGIGLALVDALKDNHIQQNSAKYNKGNVLFGTQLRLKIPTQPPSTYFADVGLPSPSGYQNWGIYTEDSPRELVTGVVSLSEMELSEEYTCVKSHGTNPRTTHIFDNCVVNAYCSLPDNSHSASGNFLSFCYTCKMHLDQTKDIFIYRGEKAFCSRECRYREMVLDGAENSEFDSNGHASL